MKELKTIMANTFWIKLYLEILNDPKMGNLSDRLFRRSIELFLLAGDNDKDGLLPDIDDIAWRLRVDKESLQQDIQQLINLNILEYVDECLSVKNFAKWQGSIPINERMKKYRERKQKEEYYQGERECNESDTGRYTDKNRLNKNKTEENREEQNKSLGVVAYEQNIGIVNPILLEKIQQAEQLYTPPWVVEAIQVAISAEKRSWGYALGVLQNWKKNGKNNHRPRSDIVDTTSEAVYKGKYITGNYGKVGKH